MRNVFRVIKRYAKTYAFFFKICFIADLEYRTNFMSGVLVEIGYLLIKVMYAIVVYQTGVVIGGLNPDAILIFIGMYIAMTGLFMGLFSVSFNYFINSIRDGTFDFYMTKPINLQFLATTRFLNFSMPLPNLTAGIIMMCIGWARSGIEYSFVNIAGFSFFFLCAILLNYGLFLIPMVFAFWTLKLSGVMDITYAIWDFQNMPAALYPRPMQIVGMIIVPVFLITNMSPLFALGMLTWPQILWGAVAPILFLILSSKFFYFGVKHYKSASS